MKKKDLLVILTIFACYFFVASIMHLDTLCIFKATTGIPCPGCGTTRATIALLRGDFLGALWYHPLVIITWVLILIVVIKDRTKFTKRTYDSTKFWSGAIALYLGVYVYRMILFFPNSEPLDFNNNSLIIKVFNSLFG